MLKSNGLKSITLVLFSVFVTHLFYSQDNGQFTDARDGRTYKTVKIGKQVWMAENLSFSNPNITYFLYNNNQNLIKLGYLYDWATACKVCPQGWKLPSNAEFLEMTNFLGNDFKKKMMLPSVWPQDENATNSSGFSGIPAGMRDQTGAFRYFGLGGYFWTATFAQQSFSFARELGKNAGNWASHEFGTNQNVGMSVRCIKDQLEGTTNFDSETLDDEYTESEYQEPQKNVYPDNHFIKKGHTEYLVYKTQTCNEIQDFYYEYTGEYKCEPTKVESYKITIDVHLNDPMYDEALVKLINLKTKEITEFDIEYIEELEDGSLNFVFSIINQPHQLILNKTKKTITWFSEWGHWEVNYFYK